LTLNNSEFSQIWVIGNSDHEEAKHRAKVSGADLNPDLLYHLQTELDKSNPYSQLYQRVKHTDSESDKSQYVLCNIESVSFNPKTYNKPTVEEIGMVIQDGQDGTIGVRDLVLHRKTGQIEHMTDEHTAYLPLRYPNPFPSGQGGWVSGLPPTSGRQSKLFKVCKHDEILLNLLAGQKITQVEWYTLILFTNPDHFNYILCSRALLQELVDDLYFCVERNWLEYFKKNQGKIKAQVYQGVCKALRNLSDPQGLKVILPSSFVGSPRHMIQL
jgi:hypothetical protein